MIKAGHIDPLPYVDLRTGFRARCVSAWVGVRGGVRVDRWCGGVGVSGGDCNTVRLVVAGDAGTAVVANARPHSSSGSHPFRTSGTPESAGKWIARARAVVLPAGCADGAGGRGPRRLLE
jgi:hypothetical protein